MSDKLQIHEIQLKMLEQNQQQQQNLQDHEHNKNIQDIQLEVIIKENESIHRTKTKASPAFIKIPPPTTTTTTIKVQEHLPDDNIASSHYGKLKLNHTNRDFRIGEQSNNENIYGYTPEMANNNQTKRIASEKSKRKIKCCESINFSEIINNFISNKQEDRMWKHLKWPLFIIILVIFLALITYTCINSKNTNKLFPNCINSNKMDNCLLVTKLNRSELSSVGTNTSTQSSTSSSANDIEFEPEDITEAVLTGSTTLLRPVIVPQLLQSGSREKNYFEKGSKNDYTILERKQNPKYEESIASTTRKQIPYGQEAVEKMQKNKTESVNLVGFTSGHQNNFGIPIEEDERILRLLNDELIKLERQTTEHISHITRTDNSVIVSPTVPTILHEVESSTASNNLSEEIQCQSTSLPMCRGILQYDLTSSKAQSLYLSSTELKVFEHFMNSNCSARAPEFVCSVLEPECRPTQIGILQPCKRICKSILESCSSLIVTSDILTFTFDCDKYPDSDDKNVCEDPTRRSECYENEFKCEDMSCIPSQWQCDNIKDCGGGEDELGCLVCSPEEFRCRSNEKCLADDYRCDTNEDCMDGSDESDCFGENEDESPDVYPRMFAFASFLLPNFTQENTFTATADEDRLAAGSELNESLVTAGGHIDGLKGFNVSEIIRKVESSGAFPNISRNLANFQDSKEIMMTSDSENKLKISQANNVTIKLSTKEAQNESKSEATPACSGNELRCVSGKCITVDQLCDKIMDCAGGEDEIMCSYDQHTKAQMP